MGRIDDSRSPAEPDPDVELAASEVAGRGHAAWFAGGSPYPALRRAEIERELLFYVLASASFVEITSDLYTRNLIEFFDGDEEVVGWLERSWEREEVQHGAILKRYVQARWPDFDWETAYRNFFAEYGRICSVEQFAPSRALQLAALCVVETGTSSFYRMLAAFTTDPELQQIATGISADEVRHYKHFYRYFQRYRAVEQPARSAVLRALWSRMGEIDSADAFYAFKHVYLLRAPGAGFRRRDYRVFRDAVRKIARQHFPCEMAMKMLLKPVGLSPALGRVVLPPATSLARRLLFR